MRILLVSAYLSHPAAMQAGRSDPYYLIKELGKHHEVHYLSFANPAELEYIEPVRSGVVSLSFIVTPDTWQQRFSNELHGLRRNPLLIGRRSNYELRYKMTEIIDRYDIDLVQFEWAEAAQFLNSITRLNRQRTAIGQRNVRVILDEGEIAFQVLEDEWRAARNPLAKMEAWRRYEEMQRRELAWCRGMDGILTRTPAERDLLLSHLPHGPSMHVLVPYLDEARLSTLPTAPHEPALLVIEGSLTSNLLWFYKQIYPQIKEQLPGVSSIVVGNSESRQVQSLAESDTSIRLACTPEQIYDAYASGSAFIAPAQISVPLNYILGAMVAGRPVITTTLANRTIGAPVGEALLRADTPEQIVAHLKTVQNDRLYRERLVAGARSFVADSFQYTASLTGLEYFYTEVMENTKL